MHSTHVPHKRAFQGQARAQRAEGCSSVSEPVTLDLLSLRGKERPHQSQLRKNGIRSLPTATSFALLLDETRQRVHEACGSSERGGGLLGARSLVVDGHGVGPEKTDGLCGWRDVRVGATSRGLHTPRLPR